MGDGELGAGGDERESGNGAAAAVNGHLHAIDHDDVAGGGEEAPVGGYLLDAVGHDGSAVGDDGVAVDGHDGGRDEAAVNLHACHDETAVEEQGLLSVEDIFVVVGLSVDADARDALAGGGVVGVAGDGVGGIGPHVEEGGPAEELHEADGPEHLGGLDEQAEHVLAFLLLAGGGGFDAVECGILGRVHLLDLGEGVEHAEQQDGRADVEGPCDGGGHLAGGGGVAEEECEDDGSDVAHDGAGVAEEALDAVGEALLLFVDHVADEHLEGLHGHVDGGVEQHQGHKAEDDGARHGEVE